VSRRGTAAEGLITLNPLETPMLNRRSFSIASAAAVISSPALAQTDALRIVVGFPAGGVVDVVAREVAEGLKTALARPVIVENRPGAGGRLGVMAVKGAAADGNTLLLTPSSIMTLYPSVLSKLPYDTLADFAPVSTVCMSTNALAIGMHVPARTLAEFIAWSKANPKDANYASPGAGSAPHFLGAQIAQAAGLDLLHVPYKGAPDILNDLYGGRIASFVTALSNAVQPHRDGRMRILVTTGERRSPLLPDVPTTREAGYGALTGTEWFGLLAPAATPADRVAALHAAVAKAVSSDAIKVAFGKLVLDPDALAPAEFANRIKTDIARWASVANSLNYQRVDAT
jgi:tripartite-type tricarboxylate transporter receptor subunit TctC